jgi:uncharacterized protein YcbK (DUF882 family)
MIIKDGKYFKIVEFQSPDDHSLILDMRLIEALDRVREAYGHPMIVNSGYRSERHNRRVGGVPNSYHRKGMAADIRPKALFAEELAVMLYHIRQEPLFEGGGIGVYPTRKFIHVDVRGYQARWGEPGKSYQEAIEALH